MTRFSQACAVGATWLDTINLGEATAPLMTGEGVQMVHALALANLESMADRDPSMPSCGHAIMKVILRDMRQAQAAGDAGDQAEMQRCATNLVAARLVAAAIGAGAGHPPGDLRGFLIGFALGDTVENAVLLAQLCEPGSGRDDGPHEPEPQPDPTPGERINA